MTLVGRKHGRGADAVIAECRAELLELGGPARVVRREEEISALPIVIWNGRMLYTLRCCGSSGRGPHPMNVPLALVWSLIRLAPWFCPYHAGDAYD